MKNNNTGKLGIPCEGVSGEMSPMPKIAHAMRQLEPINTPFILLVMMGVREGGFV